MSWLSEHMDRYRAAHRTVGCRVTHMFGVPMIAASLPVAFLDWRWAVGLFVLGWALQLAGHRFFERNAPVLASDPSNALTYVVALIFVMHEWARLLAGHMPGDEPLMPKKG